MNFRIFSVDEGKTESVTAAGRVNMVKAVKDNSCHLLMSFRTRREGYITRVIYTSNFNDIHIIVILMIYISLSHFAQVISKWPRWPVPKTDDRCRQKRTGA